MSGLPAELYEIKAQIEAGLRELEERGVIISEIHKKLLSKPWLYRLIFDKKITVEKALELTNSQYLLLRLPPIQHAITSGDLALNKALKADLNQVSLITLLFKNGPKKNEGNLNNLKRNESAARRRIEEIERILKELGKIAIKVLDLTDRQCEILLLPIVQAALKTDNLMIDKALQITDLQAQLLNKLVADESFAQKLKVESVFDLNDKQCKVLLLPIVQAALKTDNLMIDWVLQVTDLQEQLLNQLAKYKSFTQKLKTESVLALTDRQCKVLLLPIIQEALETDNLTIDKVLHITDLQEQLLNKLIADKSYLEKLIEQKFKVESVFDLTDKQCKVLLLPIVQYAIKSGDTNFGKIRELNERQQERLFIPNLGQLYKNGFISFSTFLNGYSHTLSENIMGFWVENQKPNSTGGKEVTLQEIPCGWPQVESMVELDSSEEGEIELEEFVCVQGFLVQAKSTENSDSSGEEEIELPDSFLKM